MTFKVPPSQDPNADFDALVLAFMHQMGYESDNTKKGVKSAVKDYEAKLQAEPPQWVFDIWPLPKKRSCPKDWISRSRP